MSTKRDSRSDLETVDWDFADADGSSELGAFHWYPGRFVSHLPGVLIGQLTAATDLILDPFAGSGTTLLEAKRFGRRALGIDVNPAACLMARAKLTDYHAATFDDWCSSLLAEIQGSAPLGFDTHEWDDAQRDAVPNITENIRWYHPRTLKELSAIWVALGRGAAHEYADVGFAAFSSILKGCCSQLRDWGWVCDNVVPKDFVYVDAVVRFRTALETWRAGQAAFEITRVRQGDVPGVVCADSRDALADIAGGSIDAIVTSPPYLNMTDYVRSQRLTFLWFKTWQFDASRAAEIGARYKRSRKRNLDDFFSEMSAVATEMARVTRIGGSCALVAGESPNHPRWLERYSQMLEEVGFSLEQRLPRSLPRQRARRPVLQDESILILRRI